jgi:hypothetical protein
MAKGMGMGQQDERADRTRGLGFRAQRPAPCPECGSVHWLVGRHVAECAACAALYPRADGDPVGMPRPRLLRRAA